MSTFKNYKLILPAHLNHYGFLFGGDLLKWVDEVAYIKAALDFPDCNFVTVGMKEVEFKKSVRDGSILEFEVTEIHKGDTSIQYEVNVRNTKNNDPIFSNTITFVRIDKQGEKQKI
ncbi:MAG: acyl-CoA thioesterase [Lentisphaeria bacterium]|nr:acyl-CoA thioesterase [Lentisphaeria bacterium]